MSDNDDVHSEVAPEGWGAMYNNLMSPGRRGSTSSKSSLRNKPEASSSANAAGWFGGWFASSSAKSDENKTNAKNEDSDASSEAERPKSDPSEDPSDSGSSGTPESHTAHEEVSAGGGASDLDSDGFPVDPDDNVGALLKASSDSFSMHQDSISDTLPGNTSARYSVGDTGAMMEPGMLRRERIRNRQQYVTTAAAAEVALPEDATPKEQENPSTQTTETTTGGFWTSWFGASSGGAAASTIPESKPEEKPSKEAPTKPPAAVKPATPSQQARRLLPSLPDPPEFQVDSFFMSPGGSFFRPSEPVLRFEGRLKGLPRQIAPYWSSKGPAQAAPDYRMKSSNPSTTLYMFRVS